MSKYFLSILILALAALEIESAEKMVLDFERNVEVSKWPGDKPGVVELSSEWKSNGSKSLKIDPGLMTAIGNLRTKNWKGYDVLKVTINNTSDSAAVVGFEVRDRHKGFRERHDNNFSAPAGINTVEIDISGDLWRGEENKPYLGKIKTPIEINSISRIAFTNRSGKAIYIDDVKLAKVEKLKADGAWAFDFGKQKTQVMGQYTAVFENTRYSSNTGFGISGRTSNIGKAMSFPTPLLGDGIGFNSDTRFSVDLKGGKMLGLVVFERGGFWGDEQCSYEKAELKVNGKTAHSHDYSTDGQEYFFQDTEITQYENVMDKLIWPAHARGEFTFTAKNGKNDISLDVTGSMAYPLRIAGLILAPDNAAGKSFIDGHIALQEKAFKRSFGLAKKGTGSQSVDGFIVEQRYPGENIYPDSKPNKKSDKISVKQTVISGQIHSLHLAMYSNKTSQVSVSSKTGAAVSYGVYMPMRPYGTGSLWFEVSHYYPKNSFSIGKDLARSVIIDYDTHGKTGKIRDTIEITASGKKISIPVELNIIDKQLVDIPIPIGLFMNGSYVDPKFTDETTWWKSQDSILKAQMRAGMTAVSGGKGLNYGNIANPDFSKAKRFVKMAQSHGTVHAIVPYGGFIGNLKRTKNFAALAKVIKQLEDEGMPRHYLYAYDEPRRGTDEMEKTAAYMAKAQAAGLKTIGYTSWHGESEKWMAIFNRTFAPAYNGHNADNLKFTAEKGKEPWVYNNGLERSQLGLRLWQSIKLGAKGRMDWIGLFRQGFAFHNLDGREPSKCCFLIHKEYGVMPTPKWLSAREGLLDARIRFTLEKYVPASDPVLKLWSTDGYRNVAADKAWTNEKLDEVRKAMIQRLLQVKK